MPPFHWKKKSNYGLVIDWKFHARNRWVSVFAPFLVQAIIREFDPVIISSQFAYEFHKKKIKFIISMEPGWAAPKIKYDIKREHIVCVMVSDPHNKTNWFADYINANNINYVLSQYKSPFFYHFPRFIEEKFIHFPWAVPECLLSRHILISRGNEVAIFGGRNSDAYDIRNWCRIQEGIIDFSNSGVENKKMNDEEFYRWLQQFDAIIAAGSSNPRYDLVTPKYFEICAAGALLIGQYCKDIEELGFNESNSIIFNKNNFCHHVLAFKKQPEKYLSIRNRGRELIKQKHMVGHRINLLKSLLV